MLRRETNLIVIHCADTPALMDIGADEIREWHRQRGWSDIGYHAVIRRTGVIELGRDWRIAGAHAQGYNSRSVGVCLVGGRGEDGPEDNFTVSQYAALNHLVAVWGRIWMGAEVVGHRDLNPNKDCPCFDVKKYFRRVT